MRIFTRRKRAKIEQSGRIAEYFAAVHLLFKGYVPFKIRYKTRMGEIDLICIKGKMIIMVEVKKRKTLEEGILAITPKQKMRLYQAATYFIKKHDWAKGRIVRYDAVIVCPNKFPRHIKDAMRPEYALNLKP